MRARTGIYEHLMRLRATPAYMRLVARASRAAGASPRWLFRRLARLRREGFVLHPYFVAEIARLGLLDPATPAERLDNSVSGRRFRPLQLRLSPPPLSALIDDKALFYTVCRASGLPVPEVHAFVYRDEPGWTRDGRSPLARAEWAAALRRLLGEETIAKPTRADMGDGLRAFRREGDRFLEGDRAIGDAADLHDSLFAESFDGFVLQQRARNHPSIAEIGGSTTLQTARVVTLVDRDGEVRFLYATHKIASVDGVTDNVHGRQAGNGSAAVDVETGTLGRLLLPGRNGRVGEYDVHPLTGSTCRGRRLPWWEETLEVVRRAARAFGMLRTIGWDVAITADGPLLLEANSGWGPSNGVVPMQPVLRRLEEAVRAETVS